MCSPGAIDSAFATEAISITGARHIDIPRAAGRDVIDRETAVGVGRRIRKAKAVVVLAGYVEIDPPECDRVSLLVDQPGRHAAAREKLCRRRSAAQFLPADGQLAADVALFVVDQDAALLVGP